MEDISWICARAKLQSGTWSVSSIGAFDRLNVSDEEDDYAPDDFSLTALLV